jgi:hypothetical protein
VARRSFKRSFREDLGAARRHEVRSREQEQLAVLLRQGTKSDCSTVPGQVLQLQMMCGYSLPKVQSSKRRVGEIV